MPASLACAIVVDAELSFVLVGVVALDASCGVAPCRALVLGESGLVLVGGVSCHYPRWCGSVGLRQAPAAEYADTVGGEGEYKTALVPLTLVLGRVEGQEGEVEAVQVVWGYTSWVGKEWALADPREGATGERQNPPALLSIQP